MYETIVSFIKALYPSERPIPLHRPVFSGREKEWLAECIESNFVSSVGKRVDEFEERVADFVGARYAVATVNGTAALHVALLLCGVEPGTEVISQALTFVATSNAIAYCGATPQYVDVDRDTMGMSPRALRAFLDSNLDIVGGHPVNRWTGNRLSACLPMHTFGHPCRIEKIVDICSAVGIPVVEDSAESLGSLHKGRHTGTFGRVGIFSFNGNKIITTGGGGMIVTDDENLGVQLKHITTTGKRPHPFVYFHDTLAFNYRMPNLNAALGCAQIEQLEEFVHAKREIAGRYRECCLGEGIGFLDEPIDSTSNFWLNAIMLEDSEERDAFLQYSNEKGVMTRPVWTLMNQLPMYEGCAADELAVSRWSADRIVNLPSSVPT